MHLIGEATPGRARAAHPGYTDAEAAAGYGSNLALSVPDLDAALARLAERGIAPVGHDVRGDGVRRAFLRDADAHVVELMQDPAGVQPRP